MLTNTPHTAPPSIAMQPAGTPVNLVLKIAHAASPLPDDLAARVAQALSTLTPGYTWAFSSQQVTCCSCTCACA
jgi:hypothetical protein